MTNMTCGTLLTPRKHRTRNILERKKKHLITVEHRSYVDYVKGGIYHNVI